MIFSSRDSDWLSKQARARGHTVRVCTHRRARAGGRLQHS
jgi:hypothetical protein